MLFKVEHLHQVLSFRSPHLMTWVKKGSDEKVRRMNLEAIYELQFPMVQQRPRGLKSHFGVFECQPIFFNHSETAFVNVSLYKHDQL